MDNFSTPPLTHMSLMFAVTTLTEDRAMNIEHAVVFFILLQRPALEVISTVHEEFTEQTCHNLEVIFPWL